MSLDVPSARRGWSHKKSLKRRSAGFAPQLCDRIRGLLRAGKNDEAIAALYAVTGLRPDDVVAKKLLFGRIIRGATGCLHRHSRSSLPARPPRSAACKRRPMYRQRSAAAPSAKSLRGGASEYQPVLEKVEALRIRGALASVQQMTCLGGVMDLRRRRPCRRE